MPTISEIAAKNNRLMLALVFGLMIFGLFSYNQLPSQEDPKITIREAVITTNFPGMSAEKIELLITKTIEEAIRELPQIDEIRSVSMPGSSIIHAETKQTVPGEGLDQVWDELRNELEAVRGDLPEGTGPYIINDDFEVMKNDSLVIGGIFENRNIVKLADRKVPLEAVSFINNLTKEERI